MNAQLAGLLYQLNYMGADRPLRETVKLVARIRALGHTF